MAKSERKIHRKTRSQNDEGMYDYNSAHLHQASETLMRERNPKRRSICECAQSAKGSFSNRTFCKEKCSIPIKQYRIQHVFLCINICWTPRMMLTTPEGFGRC